MKKNFNPKEWLTKPEVANEPKPIASLNKKVAVLDNDIEIYITAIEQSGTDITGNYAAWRDIGFALSEEYGESGRDYYHRVSKNYSGYDAKECDTQFNSCLKAKGHGITIATFYHHAHQSGIPRNHRLQPMITVLKPMTKCLRFQMLYTIPYLNFLNKWFNLQVVMKKEI
jgi:hypothetical protein